MGLKTTEQLEQELAEHDLGAERIDKVAAPLEALRTALEAIPDLSGSVADARVRHSLDLLDEIALNLKIAARDHGAIRRSIVSRIAASKESAEGVA